ncbi:putative 1-phosphatidylinositol-3-phosphate 5-kinase FAB1C [Bienertia sinuspersici]
MGVFDSPLLDLIDKVRSWTSLGKTKPSFFLSEFNMDGSFCCQCELKFSELCPKYSCLGCRRLLCGSCSLVANPTSNSSNNDDHLQRVIKACKFCSKASKRHIEKIYPSDSPRAISDSLSPPACETTSNNETVERKENDCVTRTLEFQDHNSRMLSFSGHPSQVSFLHSPTQSDEEPEETGRHFFSSASEYFHDDSDIDTCSLSCRNECYSYRSGGSSPLDSPSRFNINTPREGRSVQQTSSGSPNPLNGGPTDMAVLKGLDRGAGDLGVTDGRSDEVTITDKQNVKLSRPLDFENNGHIWLPPPPEDEEDEAENNYFEYDDDDDDVVGASAGVFSSTGGSPESFAAKESPDEEREPLRSVIQDHFRALVSQLLQGEGINNGKENDSQDWLDIVSNLAWQAANFVKPDTSKGGSMDPGDYVKIKCIASGSPNESTLVKGIVCTKNIKHKRMTSQYKTPRLLLLGGSLEYQRAQNQLASFNTLLEEEMNQLKVIVSKIEAHRTNVLLVEKSVSSYAQEYLLEKEISLVLNVKRPLLERIARSTGALITPSVDNISVARVGHCELFRLEKVSEELETSNQFNKRSSKTLMFFEGCPRRLGCTVLLKGLRREELKRIKHVVQYAIFAAYHLSLETSFLADEGAHLPKMKASQVKIASDDATLNFSCSDAVASPKESIDLVATSDKSLGKMVESQWEVASDFVSSSGPPLDATTDKKLIHMTCNGSGSVESKSHVFDNLLHGFADTTSGLIDSVQSELVDKVFPEDIKPKELENIDENEVSGDCLVANESHQSILVSFSSRCVSKGTLCERSRLLRIRFYSSCDKPLGRYLRDDLFDQASVCWSCKEPVEAHVQCYTHRQGVLTINVRRVDKVKLSGARDGKIWMWHRCLRCEQIDDVPPATRRVILSDAAWGLSFGKFLELSFSNHVTANRVASCGHSLQRDCLRFYGYWFGSMVAFFHYSPVDILTVHLPPSMLEFNCHNEQEWMKREVEELKTKMETFYAEVSDVLHVMEQKSMVSKYSSMDSTDLHKHILELKDLSDREKKQYYDMLQPATEDNVQLVERTFDILELNQLRRSLVIDSQAWDRRFYSLDFLLNSRSFKLETGVTVSHAELMNASVQDSKFVGDESENGEYTESHFPQHPNSDSLQQEGVYGDGEVTVSEKSLKNAHSPASNLSDKIDSAWTGTGVDASEATQTGHLNHVDNLPLKRLMGPARVYSFDSAMRLEETYHRRSQSTSHLFAVRSFHASGDYKSMVKDSNTSIMRTLSQVYPNDAQLRPSFISASYLAEGPRLMHPKVGESDLVIGVYDDEPTSVISYALSSKEYENGISDKLNQQESGKEIHREDSVSVFLSWQSFGSLELDYMNYGSYNSEDTLSRKNTLVNDQKRSPHLQIFFDDDSSPAGGKVKFSVTCYFAKQFDMLQRKCCPSKLDFVRSLSRCKRWSAQGGKSNVYFAKSMDERFIIKQVTKTELESFQEFAAEYFKYLNDSLDSGSPTCLAKVVGIFQVTVKHVKGGRETKMDLMVMENLFFERTISRIYDLKGSSRSRYNPDTTGANKVLLDMNLLETLRTNPIFLEKKAKRRLERAVWNDTSFLASVDVMDYSLLVGVDEERKELVLGIIDFMRQYTWDKHLETWVKASGILGGMKNASPTIISPKQYKRRFRKAMTNYFLTVPDQWSS